MKVALKKMEEKKEKGFTIRTATMDDLDSIAAVEAECFPAAEAAAREEFEDRIRVYGSHFWLLYEKADMHRENGAWQMIFGVNTIQAYRRRGLAGLLLKRAIADAREQGRKGLVLTCKDHLVSYYAGFGFEDEGISDKSTHGDVAWHQLRLRF